MPDPVERFIEAATFPLVDNPELQIAARHELAGIIENAVPATGDSLDTAAARLEAADRKPHGEWWRPTVYIATAIISAWVLVTSWSSFAPRPGCPGAGGRYRER